MVNISFTKMHGLGNDFVVIDTRQKPVSLEAEEIIFLCDRQKGIGCDQLVIIENSDRASCFVRFYNPDASESGACGNASRCVAWFLMQQMQTTKVILQTEAGLLECKDAGDDMIEVIMGTASLQWQDIPLASEVDTMHLPISSGPLKDGVAVNIGNPHAVFFVENVEVVELQKHGASLEKNSLFPQNANIGIAECISENKLKLRVFERGAGETQACGSGACAAAVAAYKRGFVTNKIEVLLQGGSLLIEINEQLDVTMTGPISNVFSGEIETVPV